MNTYAKYCPNVFVAKCQEQYDKGETIEVETKYGKKNESIVFNLVAQKDGFFYYSIVRADGFDARAYAAKKAERLQSVANNAEAKSTQYFEASQEGKDFLVLGEPIKIGHHSEKRHRALIDRNWNRMAKCVEFDKKAKSYESRIEYWESRTDIINLSMPESMEYYEYKLQKATERHEGIKNGTIPKEHGYTLTYAKKEVNEMRKNLDIAIKLWG
jgi:hypothetical protein